MRLVYEVDRIPAIGERILVVVSIEDQDLVIRMVADHDAKHQIVNLMGMPFISHRTERDDVLSANVQRSGVWELAESLLLTTLMPRGGVGVDIGANIGCHTLSLARIAGHTGAIYAIEPDPDNFIVLCANSLLAAQREATNAKIELQRIALGKTPGSNTLWRFHRNPALATLHPSAQFVASVSNDAVGNLSVPVGTLDILRFGDGGIRPLIERPIDFIKSDAQGAELTIIQGARQTLVADKPVLCLEFEPYIAGDERCLALLDELEELNYLECRLFYANESDSKRLLSQVSRFTSLKTIRQRVAQKHIGPYATLLLSPQSSRSGI